MPRLPAPNHLHARRPFRIAQALTCAAALLAPLALAAPPATPATPGRNSAATPATVATTTVPAPRCIDEEGELPAAPDAATPVADNVDPRNQLQGLVGEALRRSQAVGAARLLAEAAESDTEEARAATKPSMNANVFLGGVGSKADKVPETRGGQARVAVNLGASLYDAGRVDRLVEWRERLAESARLGQLSLQEQVALQSLGLALERNRYRLQARVYQQYARKMACLVEALEQIVGADKGRASELVQARKTLQQAELSRVQSLDAMRQSEIRLRRFVGDAIPSGEGLSALLTRVPDLVTVQKQAEGASEIGQLAAQADAAARLADAVKAGQKPQVGWLVSAQQAKGAGSPSAWSVGLTLNIPLLSPGDDASAAAAVKRAEAARLQREDALENRRARAADVHDQAVSAYDRARRTVDVLRDSDRVRGFTLQQWRQLGRRSLFDVMSAESEHYALRVAHVNALHDGQQATALLWSLGGGLESWLK